MVFSSKVASIEHLREAVSGRVITPDDDAYDQSRSAWDLTYKSYPAVIVVAQNTQDIVAAVNFAHEANLSIAVQSTGHGMQYAADDNLLIITSQMRGVTVDVHENTARAEAGAIWKDILDKSTPLGLAPLLGSSPHVGVVGYTLGRGIGWLSRRYGFAADSLRGIELVTSDGKIRRASPTEHAELFWGLRGGGGNFGVVTALEFELYPVPTIYGGDMTYPGDAAGDALRFFREWVKTAPDELTASIAVMKFPSLPFVPKEMWGKQQVIVRAAYDGDVQVGESYIQQWLDWRTPLTNTFHEMPFAEIGTIQKDPVNPTAGFGSNELARELSDGLIEVILRHMTRADSPMTFTEIRHAGGAITRFPADANAIAHRDAEFYVNVAGLTPTPEAYEAVKQYVPQYKADLRPYVMGGVYLNFMKGAEAKERIHDAFPPEIFERLLALKQQYDPQNRFRYSYQLVSPEQA